MRAPGVVVIGGYINGLGIVRSLASRNVRAAVITTERFDIAHKSRFVSAHEPLLEIGKWPEQLIEVLERRASDWRGWALLPAHDQALAAVAEHQDVLCSTYRVIAPSWEAARCFLDKGLMLDAARNAGIQVPHCYGPANATTAARQDLRFPLIVKPLVGYRFSRQFGSKLFVAPDREALSACVARITAAKVPCDVFDLIPGPDSQIYAYCLYMYGNGEPSAGLTVRKLRQSPPFFGVARVAEIAADNPGLREQTVELLRRIGHRGMAAAEFKLDPRDGTFRFMEVNGRSVIYNRLLQRAGVDLVGLAWSDYIEGRREPAQPNHWPGVWINLHADLLYSALNRRQERLSFREFIEPYGRPKIDAIWSVRDPLPFLTLWSRTARESVGARERRLPTQ